MARPQMKEDDGTYFLPALDRVSCFFDLTTGKKNVKLLFGGMQIRRGGIAVLENPGCARTWRAVKVGVTMFSSPVAVRQTRDKAYLCPP